MVKLEPLKTEDDLVTSDSKSRCPICGAETSRDRSGGLCPSCVLQDVLDEHEERYDGHEIQEEIARGGMGVVYRALQTDPEREVALKTLLGVSLSSASARERFRLEARAMASLQHPGILPIYACGEQDGVPYFTMQLVTGRTLAQRRTRYQGAWREIAGLIAHIADAVQYAHERGVLHRDLKPGNILFDGTDRAFVCDFGLAKLAEEEAGLTHGSSLMGTPSYMAPELAAKEPGAATTASDVWGLGVILYELCAQRLPFEAESTAALLRRIAEDTAPPLPREVPRDLGVITFKALAKEPSQRYASARELADDLRRWIDGRPVLAQPASTFERLLAWARRHPGLAASLAIIAAMLFGFGLVERRNVARLRLSLAQTQLREVRLQRASVQAGQRFDSINSLKQLAAGWPQNELALVRTEAAAALALPDIRPIQRWPVSRFAVTGTETFSGDLARYVVVRGDGVAMLDSKNHTVIRHWPQPGARAAQEFRFSPGAAWLRVDFDDSHSELWPVEGGREAITNRAALAVHPNNAQFFEAREGKGLFAVSLLDGKERLVFPSPLHQGPLLLDPPGERILVIRGIAPEGLIARVSDGATMAVLPSLPRRITALEWSPDGRWIAVADGAPPYAIVLHDAGNGQERARFLEHLMPVRKLRFHPGGGSFAAVSDGHELIWRSIEPGGFRVVIPASARALEFSADGTRLGYSPNDNELGILEVVESDVFRAWPESPPDETGAAYTMAFSRDARWAAVASDKSLRVWNAQMRRPASVHSNGPRRAWWSTVCFSPDERPSLYWSFLGNGIWHAGLDAAGQWVDLANVSPLNDVLAQELSEDGRSLVVTVGQGEQKRAELWREGDPARARLLGSGIPFAGFRLLRGGKVGISTHFSEPDLWLWNAETAQRIRSLGLKEPVASEPSPDGRWLLTGTRSEHRIWDTSTWEPVARWASRLGERDVWAPAFSPDSKFLVKASPSGEITLRRVPSGEEVLTLIPARPLRLQQILFSGDGRRLMMLQSTGRICEWDVEDLRAKLEAMGLGW